MYRVKFTPDALKQLEQLDKSISQQALKKLRWMAENFDQTTHLPLTGKLKGVFKLRMSDYRALYTFEKTEMTIIVHAIKHRREIYKNK